MMDIYMMQYNYRSTYLVVIIENIYVSVDKYENNKFDQPLLYFQPKNIFTGKSRICEMTDFSVALNNPEFDVNTILLECEDNEYDYISGLEIFKFKTDDKIIDYISLIGNNMVLYAIIIGEKYTNFIYNRYNFIENVKIEEGSLLYRTKSSLHPFDYHVEKCGEYFSKKLECSLIHTFWPGVGEDIEDEEDVNLHELEYTDGSNEVVKILSQKSVICLGRDSEYAFKQCGHHCLCEECYQIKSNFDILKCVVCRT